MSKLLKKSMMMIHIYKIYICKASKFYHSSSLFQFAQFIYYYYYYCFCVYTFLQLLYVTLHRKYKYIYLCNIFKQESQLKVVLSVIKVRIKRNSVYIYILQYYNYFVSSFECVQFFLLKMKTFVLGWFSIFVSHIYYIIFIFFLKTQLLKQYKLYGRNIIISKGRLYCLFPFLINNNYIKITY